MDCFAVLVTQSQWLANVSMATVSDMCPINLYTVFYCLLILIMIPFVYPIFLMVIHYVASWLIYGYQYYYGLSNTSNDDKAWDRFLYFLGHSIRYYARIVYGIEIEGFENIPTEGGALIIGYHGPLPLDLVYLVSEVYLAQNRLARPVVHRAAFDERSLRLEMKVLKTLPGTIETCSKVLKDGHLMIIAPGGANECLFGDNNYELLWKNRLGYAKVAIEAKAPIIPVFTVNIGEAFRTHGICRSWRQKIFPKWMVLSMVFFHGGWPVKLRTFVGKPIPYDPALTPEELNQKVKMSIEQMIKDHQRLPGSIPMAILERFKCQKKVKAT